LARRLVPVESAHAKLLVTVQATTSTPNRVRQEASRQASSSIERFYTGAVRCCAFEVRDCRSG